MDANEVKGFLQQQSLEERQAFAARMHERIVETFTKLLEVELDHIGKLQEWQGRIEKVKEAAQQATGEADVAQAREELNAFVQQAIPDYDAFLLKAGLRIRKAFVGTLTK
jgi:hypothetical protein